MFDLERQMLKNILKEKQAELDVLRVELDKLNKIEDKTSTEFMLEQLKESQIKKTLGKIAGIRVRLKYEFSMFNEVIEKELDIIY